MKSHLNICAYAHPKVFLIYPKIYLFMRIFLQNGLNLKLGFHSVFRVCNKMKCWPNNQRTVTNVHFFNILFFFGFFGFFWLFRLFQCLVISIQSFVYQMEWALLIDQMSSLYTVSKIVLKNDGLKLGF